MILKVARNGGYSEEGLKALEFGVSVFEVRFGGKAHFLKFFWRDSFETAAIEGGFTIFDFSKIDVVSLG